MPEVSSTLLVSLLAPAVMLMFGMGFLVLWSRDHRRTHLIPAFLACVTYAIATTMQILQFPPGTGLNSATSAAGYTLAATLVAQAVLVRSKRAFGWPIYICGPLLAAAAMTWYSYVSPSLLMRIYALNFGLGLLLLAAVWRVRTLARGNASDRLLFWMLLVFGLHFFPRTILSTAIGLPNATSAYGAPFFWTALQVGLVFFGGALAMALVAATASDTIEEVRRERDVDGLTELVNRRAFFEITAARLASAADPISLVVGDIDHFKSINDSYGHAAGDAVLRNVGTVIRRDLRSQDIAGRLGGEEFAILLPDTDRDAAFLLVERLRRRLEQTAHDVLPTGKRITASFGIAQRSAGESVDQLVDRADRLLYAAKSAGRNRCVIEALSGGDPLPANVARAAE